MVSLVPRVLFEGGARRLGDFQTGLATTKGSALGAVKTRRDGANNLDHGRHSAFTGHRFHEAR
jgi:hypothetical protein